MLRVKWDNRYKCYVEDGAMKVCQQYRLCLRVHLFNELDYRKPALGRLDPPTQFPVDTSVPAEVRADGGYALRQAGSWRGSRGTSDCCF